MLLGSSGVGKSTLINSVLGVEQLETQEIRDGDDRGRHTTTHRELIVMPGGGLVIDTPGLRELQLWGEADGGIGEAFNDVTELAAACRFHDCAHETEPGCAGRSAIDSGALPAERLESYRKLQRELARLERRRDSRAQSLERQKWRKFSKEQRGTRRPAGGRSADSNLTQSLSISNIHQVSGQDRKIGEANASH